MKFLRIMFAVGLLALIAVPAVLVAVPASTVEASSCTEKVVPFDALEDWTTQMGDNPSTTFDGVETYSGTSAVAAGAGAAAATGAALETASAAGAAGAGATALGVAAVFLASFEGTCLFFDWWAKDGALADEVMQRPLIGSSLITTNTAWGGYYVTGGYATYRTLLNVGSSTTIPTGMQLCHNLSNQTKTQGGVTFSPIDWTRVDAIHRVPNPGAPTLPGKSVWGLSTERYALVSDAVRNMCSGSNTNAQNTTPIQIVSDGDCHITFDGLSTTQRDIGGGYYTAAAVNVGGACATPPGAIWYTYNPSNTSAPVTHIGFLDPLTNTKGWMRYLRTDVKCLNPSTGATTWTTSNSPSFRELEPTQRMQAARCPTNGHIPIDTIATRPPVGVVCTTGVVCWPGTLLYRIKAPASWETLATLPAHAPCLASGSGCGAPQLDGSQCEWPFVAGAGGTAVAASFCNPTRQSPELIDVAEIPGPEATGTVTAVPRLHGDPARTMTEVPEPEPDPSEPGTGVTVNVPIDDGGFSDNPCTHDTPEAAVTTTTTPTTTTTVPGATPQVFEPYEPPEDLYGPAGLACSTEDAGECWPNGWGWFNPAQWVYRPLKCAAVWAFVPPDGSIGGEWQEFYNTLQTTVPFAWVFDAYEAVTSATSGMAAAIEANDEDCFEVMPDVSEYNSSITTADRSVCPATLAATGGPLAAWGPFRDVAGIAVWVFWLITLGRALWPEPSVIVEDSGQMAWNF